MSGTGDEAWKLANRRIDFTLRRENLWAEGARLRVVRGQLNHACHATWLQAHVRVDDEQPGAGEVPRTQVVRLAIAEVGVGVDDGGA